VIIEGLEFQRREDLIGRHVVCVTSTYHAYTPGEVYLVEKSPTGTGKPTIAGCWTGASATWRVLVEPSTEQDWGELVG
jgi:hypothetical protein